MKHVSGGAAWSERVSTKSTQKQYAARPKPASGRATVARRTCFAARRACDRMSAVIATPIPAISTTDAPHAASHAPSVPRSAMPRRMVSRAMYA